MRNETALRQIERQAKRAIADCESELREWPAEPPRLRFVIDQLPPPAIFRRLPEGVRIQLFVGAWVEFARRLWRRPEAERVEVKQEMRDTLSATFTPWDDALDDAKVCAAMNAEFVKLRQEYSGRR